MSSWRRPLSILALLVALLACNLPTTDPASLALTVSPAPAVVTTIPLTTTPAPALYQPGFEAAACAFPVPAGYNPECGYLLVPENRTRADGPWIRLHVAVFRGRSGSPGPDPVVHLSGGPGSSSLQVAQYMFDRGLDAVLDQRDLVLFDQRGTGYSQPRLDCPERASITGTILEQGLASEPSRQLAVEAFHRCRERLLAQGIDLSAYRSAASAADLNDLRLALGYETLNLYAVSYGTRLALTTMRDHPAAVRSAVLDSAYPLQVHLYTALAPNAARAFELFFGRCAADPGCNSAYPDLRTAFFQLVDQLNANPVFITIQAGGAQHNVRVDGGLLIDVLFVGLYNPAVTASMPQMIYEIRQGEYGLLRERLALYFDPSSALGVNMAVQCGEEIPFGRVEDTLAAAQGVAPQIAAFYPLTVLPLFSICQEWTSAPPVPRENEAVRSDIPALILAGDVDPITPPDWGRMVAGDLSHAYFREFPGHGHWVTRSSSCALQMALAFWQDPNTDPAYVCP